jgi:hypothetical protein
MYGKVCGGGCHSSWDFEMRQCLMQAVFDARDGYNLEVGRGSLGAEENTICSRNCRAGLDAARWQSCH